MQSKTQKKKTTTTTNHNPRLCLHTQFWFVSSKFCVFCRLFKSLRAPENSSNGKLVCASSERVKKWFLFWFRLQKLFCYFFLYGISKSELSEWNRIQTQNQTYIQTLKMKRKKGAWYKDYFVETGDTFVEKGWRFFFHGKWCWCLIKSTKDKCVFQHTI